VSSKLNIWAVLSETWNTPQPTVDEAMISERAVKNRLFPFADLACVSTSIIIWELRPGSGWWPLLIALIPWFLRLLAGVFPFQRTRLELPFAIFVLTAAVGVWAAYSPEDASAKFWILIGGILLYYALAGQPQENLWSIAGFLSFVGVGIACFFLLTNDWQQYPAKISLLDDTGLWWMKVRPTLGVTGMHPNAAGGLIALTVPFLVAIGINAWQEKRVLVSIWVVVGGILISTTFLLATSRSEALALAAGMGMWLLWALSNRMQHLIPWRPRTIFSVGVILLIILTAGFALFYPGGPVVLADAFPGPPNVGSRLELAQSAIKLVGDFPFTGGGLHSFPGLYSTYIRVIPFFFIANSQNVYLDVALEQSILGMLAFCFVYLGSFWLIATRGGKTSSTLLALAVFSSLLVVAVHGLLSDIIYVRWGAPLVFLLPGLVNAATRSASQKGAQPRSSGRSTSGFTASSRYRKVMLGVIGVACVAFLVLVYGYRQRLLAAWYADLGAVRMAQTELAGFPSGKWTEDYQPEELKSAERLFEQALRYDEGNRTANHRLGLIALGRREFPVAVSYLETAYQTDRSHRGIWKTLGYSYVWAGQFDQAVAMLTLIPEASYELGVYVWWWETQGRPDFAERAATMVERLESSQP